MDDEPDDDGYPGGWFGPSWGAPVNEPTRHKPTPTGDACVKCGRAIRDGDQGIILPHIEGRDSWWLVAYHLNCWRYEVLGPDWQAIVSRREAQRRET